MDMTSESLDKKGFVDYLKSKSKLLSGLFIILILVGLFLFWFDYTSKEQRIKISENFVEAKILLINNNKAKSAEILKDIINKKDKIYSPKSLFLIIDNNLEEDDKIVLKYFDIILSVRGLEKEDLNLLKLKKAIYISDSSNEELMLELLNPIINSNSVWKTQSLKFLGDYYFSNKELKKAGQYYSILLREEDPNIDLAGIKTKMKSIGNE